MLVPHSAGSSRHADRARGCAPHDNVMVGGWQIEMYD